MYVSLVFGDRYFLRMLLNVVKGFRGYDVLYTVGDVVYKKFKEACYVRGLFDDDKEWYEVIEELFLWVIGR